MDYADLALKFALLLLGLLCHFFKALIQIKKNTGNHISLKDYYLEHPYHTGLSVVGAVAGFLLLAGTEELTKVTAFGIGYLADNVVEIIGQRSKAKLEK